MVEAVNRVRRLEHVARRVCSADNLFSGYQGVGMNRGDRAKNRPLRQTVDLAEYPDLVVIYLGMRVNRPRGVKTLLGFGSKIRKSLEAKPDGLLLHENMIFSLVPPHVGMRQYWRDFESLERWARTGVHAQWWKTFLEDRGGTGFWHESYSNRGRIESVYIDMPSLGLAEFAPVDQARGSMFSARRRLGLEESTDLPSAIPEAQLYED